MRFYVLSDLHFECNTDVECVKNNLSRLCEEIRTSEYDRTILFVVLGDIVDCGDRNAYEVAEKCFDHIKAQLQEYSVHFEFVPGNHDLSDGQLEFFDSFIAKYGARNSFEQNSVYSAEYEEVNFIFADSTLSRDYKNPGKIDLEAIRLETKGKQNILFCHHGFTHDFGATHDIIENGSEVLKKLEQMRIKFAIHGHVHRSDAGNLSNGIVEIGCGTFSKNISNMPGIFNQFLVGYICDGAVVSIERYAITEDGASRFLSESLYPVAKGFADPNKKDKCYYAPVTDYIPRKVIPHTIAIKRGTSRWFWDKQEVSLLDAFLKKRRILFISDAGQGKSTELQNLANKLYETYLFPFMYSLREYTGSCIEELLPQKYQLYPPSRVALLLDGYDELSNSNKELFENHLRSYVHENPQANIVISSRSNFCGVESNNESSTFSGFFVFDLCQLDGEDLEEYLQRRGVDVERFFDAITSYTSNIAYNPFYLTKLADIFIQEGQIPNKTELMDKLIEQSFASDVRKFPGDIEKHYRSILCALQKIAFAMQLMQKYVLDDREEYQYLFSDSDIRWAKYSGLLNRVESGWQFTHNNFREYLVAKHLSQLEPEEIVSYISNGEGIRPNWVNALGYLTNISMEWDLLKWIKENSPAALVKFEPDRVEQHDRFEVFKQIFCKYEEKQLWFNDELCDEQQLAHFSNNSKTLNFLLDRISNPINNISQQTAVRILFHFKKTFGKQNEVLDCLLKCCESFPRATEYTCRLAIFAICKLELNTPRVTERLLSMFRECSNDHVRCAMYEYLVATNEHDKYIDYFLDGIPYIAFGLGSKETRIGNESFSLISGIKKVSTKESVIRVLNWFSTKHDVDFHDCEEVFKSICQTTAKLYNTGAFELYDTVLASCICMMQKHKHSMVRDAADFFDNTGTLESAIFALLNTFYGKPYDVYDIFAYKRKAVGYVISAYQKGTFCNHDAFRIIVVQFVNNAETYRECARMLKEKADITLPEFEEPGSRARAQKNELYEYFSILFDKQKANQMLEEFIAAIENSELCINEIFDARKEFDWYSRFSKLSYAIYHNGDKAWRIKDFFDKVNWDRFVAIEAKDVLQNKLDMFIDANQKAYFKQLVEKAVCDNVFINEVEFDGSSSTVSRFVEALIFLCLYFDFDLGEKTSLQMVGIHSYWFRLGGEEIKYEYLEKHLSIEKIKSQISYNVENGIAEGSLLQDHIEFCRKHFSECVAPAAIQVCKTEKEFSGCRYEALQYLYQLYGAEFICEEILPHADGEFLIEISNICDKIPKEEMRNAMEREYSKKPTAQLRSRLIILGSLIALEDYVKKVKEIKRPPDHGNDSSNSCTYAISGIRNTLALDLLCELIPCIFDKDFVDNDFHDLYSSLTRAFIECGKLSPEQTICMIEKYIPADESENRKLRFCNYITEAIKQQVRMSEDKAKTKVEVKKILQNFCF